MPTPSSKAYVVQQQELRPTAPPEGVRSQATGTDIHQGMHLPPAPHGFRKLDSVPCAGRGNGERGWGARGQRGEGPEGQVRDDKKLDLKEDGEQR